MLTIYHLVESRSERVIWLLEELGLPYQLETYRRGPDFLAPEAYRRIHPMGTSPILRDGDLLLVETGAIVEHILDRYGAGRLTPPRGTDGYSLYLQWMHFAEGSAAFSILTEAILNLSQADGGGRNRFQEVWRDRNLRMIPYLDDELGKRPYFAGSAFTAADIMMFFAIQLVERYLDIKVSDWPSLSEYCERVGARPAYLKSQALAFPAQE